MQRAGAARVAARELVAAGVGRPHVRFELGVDLVESRDRHQPLDDHAARGADARHDLVDGRVGVDARDSEDINHAPSLPASRRRAFSTATAMRRCSCGLMPRTRLNAVLSANGLPYPTCRATPPMVEPGSHRRSAASVSRQFVRNAIGGSPTSSVKRRAERGA